MKSIVILFSMLFASPWDSINQRLTPINKSMKRNYRSSYLQFILKQLLLFCLNHSISLSLTNRDSLKLVNIHLKSRQRHSPTFKSHIHKPIVQSKPQTNSMALNASHLLDINFTINRIELSTREAIH